MQAVHDDTGFEALMAQHGPSVRAAVRAMTGRSADEDDLVQEVFTRLLIRLRQDGSIDAGPWCRRAARNLAIDYLRRRSATPTEDRDMEQAYGDGLDREVLGRDTAAKLADSLWRLPEQHRRVLLAQVQSGADSEVRSHAEIGAELGLSAKAVESLLARARRRLRAELRRRGVETGEATGETTGETAGEATGQMATTPRPDPTAGGRLASRVKVVMAGAALAVSGVAAGIATMPLVTAPLAASPAGGPTGAARPPMPAPGAGGAGQGAVWAATASGTPPPTSSPPPAPQGAG